MRYLTCILFGMGIIGTIQCSRSSAEDSAPQRVSESPGLGIDPHGLSVIPEATKDSKEVRRYPFSGGEIQVEATPVLTSAHVRGAVHAIIQERHVVVVELNEEGQRLLAKKTAELSRIKPPRRLTVLLKGSVVSASRVIAPIESGTFSISRDFTAQEARELADAISASIPKKNLPEGGGDRPATAPESKSEGGQTSN